MTNKTWADVFGVLGKDSLAPINTDVSAIKDQLDDLNQRLINEGASQVSIELRSEQINDLENKIESMRGKIAKAVDQYKYDVLEIKDELTALKANYATITGVDSDLNKAIREAELIIDKVRDDVGNVIGSLKLQQAKLDNVIAIASENTDAASLNAGNIDKNTSAIATLSNRMANIEASAYANTASINTLNAAVADFNKNLTAISASISKNTSDITTNAANISKNTTSINANTASISTNVANTSTNAAAITKNTTDIATNTKNIASNYTSLDARITSLEAQIKLKKDK